MRQRLQQTLIGVLVLCATLFAAPLHAGEVAKADLDILGLGLEVDRNPVTTAVDVPAYVQTIFGGKMNDEAPSVPGLSAIGELTGPGITTPITLFATPGKKFAVPALHDKGEYVLQNIRLVGADGAFLQQAVPSFAIINVTDVLKTEVRVRQLTPEELRERGITVDLRNYEVYEYTVIFGVEEERVEIPYPVIIDKRTHQVQPLVRESPYKLPPLSVKRPPRFVPPSIDEFELGPGGGGQGPGEGGGGGAGPSIPAAIIMPSGFGVLHQFFAVALQVSNTSPEEANIRLDQITATLAPPGQMRVAKVVPAVTLGQPVPIYDSKTGNTWLIAGAQGTAEWTLEALKAGTHPIEITVEATYQKPGQEEFRLRGKASTAIVVSDPRFQINFSHPDTVRVDEEYTAYAFITNMSPQAQHVRLDMSEIPHCSSGGAVDHICRVEGEEITELDMQPGEMIPVPYKLKSQITGHVFAGAGAANDEALGVSVQLHMGVSESGIPLSPATLVMPHYAKYLPGDFIAANMQILGLGYSLATAPLNQYTAKFPRVIVNDVFQRAQEIARAGQRAFVMRANPEVAEPEVDRNAYFHLALDWLGNIERTDQVNIAPELAEWDELRRQEKSGRRAGAAMARKLEAHGLHNSRTAEQFVDDFSAATAHRNPYFLAWVHGAAVPDKTRPYALSVHGVGTGEKLDVPAEETTGWVRLMPYGELTRFDTATEKGEMAIVGRWKEGVRVVVVPQAPSFTIHVVWPDTEAGKHVRADIAITNATVGQPMSVELARGVKNYTVLGAQFSGQARDVVPAPLRVLGAAQDLHLNQQARLVSILFNRPLKVADVQKLRDQFALTIDVPKAGYKIMRRNPVDTTKPLQIPAAALQQDGRLINVTFDKALSRNANYVIGVDNLVDLVSLADFDKNDIVPRIDNDKPGAILTGRVLLADNTPVAGAEVDLDSGGKQLEVTDELGRYMYEFVPRDIDNGITGYYEMRAIASGRETRVKGSVRLPGEVHTVNLVFLGRGIARGQVRYSDGIVVPKQTVTVGSTLFNQFRTAVTDTNGNFEVGDLPVGPLTFSVVDDDGRATFAANAIRTAGEVITQDLVIERRAFPGLGKVRVTVRRSDTNEVVPNAQVGVYTQGYGLADAITDSNGFYEFPKVPAGLISIIAAHFGISRESPGIELDLRADQTIEATVIIPVPPPSNTGYVTLDGTITKDDPAAPGDRTKDTIVPGAIITIGKLPPVTAGADGKYVFADLPIAASGKPAMVVFDPATGRKGTFEVPTLLAPPAQNHFSPRLSSAEPEGVATIRVRLTSATGEPVAGYRVMEPGFPPEVFAEKGNGVYEMTGVRVPSRINIVAVPTNPNGPFGDQMTSGSARVDFAGQVAIADLRLPGQGIIITRLELRQQQDACPTSDPCYTQAFGKVAVGYSVWDEVEQMTKVKTIVLEADTTTKLNTFRKIPAAQDTAVYTDRHPAGHAGQMVRLLYEGDVRNITLRMETIGDVTGRVFAHDRQTPINGAHVKLTNSNVIYGTEATKPDGSFRFAGVQAGLSFRVIAEYTQDGIYRKGYADGSTPSGGGPVSNLTIVMREQSTIEGQVIDVNGNPVPLARYWARELAWPHTQYGTAQDPLRADINGRFILTNVFTGPFRITAVDPELQESRGDYQGELRFEGDTSQLDVKIRVGSVGFGRVTAKVIDSLQAYKAIENAEVTLYKGDRHFDFTTTDDRGLVAFENVPTGSYQLKVYSKTVGRGGNSVSFTLSEGEEEHHELVLDFLGKVAGTLTDPESTPANQPVRGMPVQVDSTKSQVNQRTSTDSNGAFTILGVPEGGFKIFAYDYDTGRMAFGPSNLEISKVVQEYNDIKLELERTAVLTVKAYLPNDAGDEGELAPLVDVLVEATDYFREAQGNSLQFPKMIPRYGYKLTVKELGGEHRVVRTHGGWAAGELAKTHSVVFPSTGTVEVRIRDGQNQPVGDAEVIISGKKVYTPADGVVRMTMPFGWISVSAKKGNVGASAGGELKSRSIPLVFTLNLGSSATVAGSVEAEEGIGLPSVGTRVLVTISSRLLQGTQRLETLTDANGNYLFTGIPIGGTRLSFLFYGPDDTTIGAELTVDIPDGTTGTFTVPKVKVDATPPRVLSIDPAPNSTNVSPSSPITVTFSEAIAASFLTPNYFNVISTADQSVLNITLQPAVRPDGTFQVKLIPPAPPAGQKYPLASNVLYRVAVKQGIQDTTGNALQATFGSSFTTVDYAEPAVVRVDPDPKEALPSNATFRIKFNKAVDITSLEAGYGGVLKLERLDTRGGEPTQNIPLSRYMDPSDPTVIVAAPTGVAIAESAFYRLTVSGVRDTQTPPNTQKDPKSVDFFSYDTRRPVAKIKSPVAAGEKLVGGISYTAQVIVTDEGTNEPSIDVESVDWFDASGKYLKTIATPPYSYTFTAPSTNVDTTYTLQVSANDLSLNRSPQLEAFTWDVVPNAAPANVAVTNTPTSAYPTQKLTSGVTFTDEGLKVTVVLKLVGKKLDGTDLTQILDSKSVERTSTTAAWPATSFTYSLPLDLAAGAAKIVAEVTDVAKTGSGEAPLEILNDTTAPEVVSFLPKAETRFAFPGTYVVELKARDNETGIKSVSMTVAGESVTPTVTVDNATGIRTYRYTATVKAKNADTRIAIVATTTDNRDNVTTSTSEVIYERVDDATIPQAAWITPLDGAAMPFGIDGGWQATLRIQATDDQAVTGVAFVSDRFVTTPAKLTAPKSGTTNIYEAKVTFKNWATGETPAPFEVKAVIEDAEPAHTVELPITLVPVVLDQGVPPITVTSSITASTDDSYIGKTLVVRGSGVRVTILVPLTVKNLIVLDGASVSTFEETKLDLTILEHVFIDADSKIDVTDKGYLGGLRTGELATNKNTERTGRTLGGTTTGGASNADASHGGIGGSWAGSTNTPYGSITEPVDFGAGGGAEPNGSRPGGNGGGVVLLRGGDGAAKFVVAGVITADAVPRSGISLWTSGAAGSINLRARTLITGPWTRITANGADEGASLDHDLGGGGGRIAVRVTERLDVPAGVPLFQARGGRNGGSLTSTGYVDGGAGTVFLVRPDSTLGELIVSSFDERNPSSVHPSAGTPLGGTLAFDRITIGPRALARFDTEPTGTMNVDSTALVVGPADLPAVTIVSSTPAAGSSVAQSTSITARYTAQSLAGVRQVRTSLSAQPVDVLAYPRWSTFVPETASSIAIPSNATPGQTTLKIIVTDRAGRVAESAPVAFTIVNNGAPVIDVFDVTPADAVYANRSIAAKATASDDVSVTALTLASSVGTVTSQTPTNPTPKSMARDFSIAIPATTASGTNVTLTLSANDGFPGRTPTTATKTVVVKKDEIAPAVTVARPSANQQYNEAAGATFDVEVMAIDAEVAVKSVIATFEGKPYPLAPVSGRPNVYAVSGIPVPDVDGTEPVAKTLRIDVTDYEPNTSTTNVTIYIKPLIDPNAPKVSWLCGSPNAMYPPGYATTLSVQAIPSSAQNGVSKVEFIIDGGTPILATAGANNVWNAAYTVPAAATNGQTLNVRVNATSTAGNVASLLGSVLVVTGTDITTTSYINADDMAWENQSIIIRSGGTKIITGTHTLKNVVVLNGGKLVQQHLDKNKADLLTVERMYVGCNASIDVTGLGHPRGSTYPGAGNPDDASGGSHIGVGGIWNVRPGGAFGSVYRPTEAGGGGHQNPNSSTATGNGGGSVRVHATGTVTIDGAVAARGVNGTYGASAGGSVWISTAGALAGAGSINVTGGDMPSLYGASGGGGSIALEYASVSGLLTSNLISRGGTGAQGRFGGAGSIYVKSASASFGDLIVNNSGVATTYGLTALPAFGRIKAASVVGNSVTLDGTRWLSPAMVGNWVRAYAPDGSERGTFRILSVTNPTTSTPIIGFHEVPTQDAIAYDGFVVYAPAGLGGKKFVAARYVNNRWEYDNDTTFTPFTPQTDDAVIASFTKDASGITDLATYDCSGGCTSVNGMPVLELFSGEFIVNGQGAGTGPDLGLRNAHELFLRADRQSRGIVLANGANASVTLADANGIVAGDLLRGVYRFDSVNITNARVFTEDLLESTTAPVVDATSSLTTGNAAAPVISAANVSIAAGLTGPIVVGSAGSVTDPQTPLFVVARNKTRATATAPVLWNAHPSAVLISNRGGMSVARPVNGLSQVNGISSLEPITGSGFVSFSASQTNKVVSAGLAPADTTTNVPEPGIHGFRLLATGTYEVWANAANASKNGTYTTSTVFRIEKTPAFIRWFVNGTQVHEVTSSIPAKLLFDISFESSDSGEIHSIEYDTNTNDNGSTRVAVAADGSFKLPITAQPGDEIVLSAWDSHLYTFRSAETTIATIGDELGAQSVTFSVPEITGGRALTGTATIRTAAGPDGARVTLAANSTNVTVPTTVTIPAGQTSQTFNITTKPVLEAADVVITATYSGVPASGTLRLLRDAIAPTITITSPAPNTQYTEGSATKIAAQATVVDEDSGVLRVFATIGGTNYDLAKDASKGANVWTAQIPVPFVDGDQPVTMDLVLTANDNNTNSATASVPVVVKPVVDPNAPTITWSCGANSIHAAGSVVKLRVTAKAPSAANPMHGVDFLITDPNNTTLPYAGLPVSGTDDYEYSFTVPADAVDGATYSIRAVARTASGTAADVTGSLTAIRDASVISSSLTISATDTTYDNKNVVITGGTTTLEGAHTFKRFVVLGGNVTHSASTSTKVGKSEITAQQVYIACGATIDASLRGYNDAVSGYGRTWPGTTTGGSREDRGGSHGGRGGYYDAGDRALAYGSPVDPDTPGGAGGNGGSNCSSCNAGGGVVRIQAQTVTIDGRILTHGSTNHTGGAGGSIRIKANVVQGSGDIRAHGGNGRNPYYWYAGGGGGRIAIEYQTLTLDPLKITAAGGWGPDANWVGGAGTVYLRKVDEQGAKVSDELILDNNGYTTNVPTPMPLLAAGTVVSTSGNELTLSAPVDEWVRGSWLEILASDGNAIASYEILSRTNTTVKVRLAEGETLNAPAGSAYRNEWRFDAVTARRGARVDTTGVDAPSVTTDSSSSMRTSNMRVANDLTLRGNVEVNGRVEAPNLTFIGATVTHAYASGAAYQSLTFDIAGTITVDAASTIDVTARGYNDASGGFGRTWPGTTTGGSREDRGGSHGGRGGYHDAGERAQAYGSPIDPDTPGGAGGNGGSTCSGCNYGGGVVRLKASALVLNGKILANGWTNHTGGAGGSIRIDAGTFTGSGEVRATGGNGRNPYYWYAGGGGGRIAVYYQNLSFDPLNITAGGGWGPDANWVGGAGTVYLRKVDANGAKVSDELILDNNGRNTNVQTPMPLLARGTVVSVSGNEITLSAPVDEWVKGSWIEILDADGSVISTYEIIGRTPTTVKVRLAANETAANAPAGAAYRGEWRFDAVTVRRGAQLVTTDIESPSISADTTTSMWATRMDSAVDLKLRGHITISDRLTAPNLTLESATVTQPYASGATTSTLVIDVPGTLTIDPNSSIDVTARGYNDATSGFGRTWPGTTTGGSREDRGGSHGGRGGYHDAGERAAAYGSIMDPNTPGGAGGNGGSTCSHCNYGGGVVRVKAGSLVVNGKILSNGWTNHTGGAGGSIRIDAGALSGTGEIRATGGNGRNPYYWYAGGGGGRIAVYYQNLTLNPLNITSGGGWGPDANWVGGAGTVYFRKITAAGAKVADELVVDNNGRSSNVQTPMAALGSGTVVSVSGNEITLSNAVNEWIVGSWIDILESDGSVRATYEIIGRTPTSVRVRLAANETEANAPQGAAYQGEWRFDTVTVRRGSTFSTTDVETASVITDSSSLLRTNNIISSRDLLIRGRFEVSGEVRVPNLRMEGALLTQPPASGANYSVLSIKVPGTITVDATSSIDVTADGYNDAVSGRGRTWPGTTANGSSNDNGGSHGGVGGQPSGSVAPTHGSIFDPSTPGGAGGNGGSNCGGGCNHGGGVVRIETSALQLDGKILANGWTNHTGGAGGSIRIDADTVSGAGEIHADGGAGRNPYYWYGSGAGGRIAIYYSTLTLDRAKITASGGWGPGSSAVGSAGTVYLKSDAQASGDLIVSNTYTSNFSTRLPAVGFGVITATSSSEAGGPVDTMTDSTAAYDAPNQLAGISVYVKGDTTKSWPILTNTATSLRLDAATPFTGIAGDEYRGLYRFDNLKLRLANVASTDRVELASAIDKDASSSLAVNDAAPVFPAELRSQIVVTNALTGDSVKGPAGAVVDTDKPVKMTVTNTRTNTTFTANANTDGSFTVPVAGEPGDTFTIYATDNHSVALKSPTYAVSGEIVELNRVASISVRPSSVLAGTGAMATIQLTNAARAAGVVVTLASSSTAVSVPSSIRVAGGTTTVQVPVTTTSVAAHTEAVLTATVANDSKTATLTVTPASAGVVDLTLASSQIQGGEAIEATVTLGAPAPAGGAIVTITSSSPAATVPPTITIPEGSLTESFAVLTTKVGALTDVTLSAAYGTSDSVTLQLSACAAMDTPTAPSSVSMKATWVNDAVPTGSTASGDATFATTQAATGTSSIYFPPPTTSDVRTFAFTGAAAFPVAPTDTLVVYALVNPCNPPRQISVKWAESATVSWTTSWGESRIDPTLAQFRAGSIPTGGQWVRLEVLAKDAGITATKNLTALTVRVDGGEAWIDSIGTGSCVLPKQAKPEYVKFETVWFDDGLPSGATSNCDVYNWDITQTASGSASAMVPNANGLHQSCFTNGTPLAFEEGDVLFAYVLIDPCNPPREIMLQWHDGSTWNRRAYWGEDLVDFGGRYSSERLKMGNLPQAGEWVRLEVPAVMLGLEGASVRGMAFTLFDGRAWFDRVGKYSRVNVARGKAATQSSTYGTGDASKAVDGDLTTINHTNNDLHSWLEIDLGAVYPVDDVLIRNRTDCCTTRLRTFDLFVSEQPFTSQDMDATIAQQGVFRYHFQDAVYGGNLNIRVERNARYVRVQLGPRDYLNLREVQVWASAGATRANVAGGSRATSSSTWDSTWTYPMHAVDGVTHDRHGAGASIFHTASTTSSAWFEVDLQSIQQISSIDVVRRPDPYDSVGPVYVIVSDVPFTSKDLATTLAQPGVSAYHYAVSWDRPIPINRTGRYVRVQKSATGTQSIGFSEFRVWSHAKLLGALSKPPEKSTQ